PAFRLRPSLEGPDPEMPLTIKLFRLLEKGAGKGGLGVTATSSDDKLGCCSVPRTDTYAISDRKSTLSCTMTRDETGSPFISFIERIDCAYALARTDTP